MQKPIIFISHITEEKELALELKKIIKKKFLSMAEVFVSSDENSIELGHEWLENITNGLKTCSIELILCSQISISRPWINFEAGAGWVRKDCRVIPICHSNMHPDSLPLPLNLLQGMMLNDKIKFQELLKIIANQVGCDVPELDCDDFITFVKAFEEKYTYWNIVNDCFERLFNMLVKYGTIQIDEQRGLKLYNNKEQFKLFIRDLLNRRQYENICVYISNYDSTIFEKLEKLNIMSSITTGMGKSSGGNYTKFTINKLTNFDNIVFNENFIFCLNEVTNAK